MNDKIFEEIKDVFYYKFKDNILLINNINALSAEFDYESDAKWFYLNICHPENLKKEEYPINFVSSVTPIGDLNFTKTEHYTIKFEVLNKDKLIELLKNK
jgi:hypothetical protein